MEKKKDLRVQKTYRALMAAFEALMAEETFDDITVNELCARALIRRPTFYSHFEDKYDFLRFTSTRSSGRSRARPTPRPTRPLSISSARGARSSPL